MKVNVCAECKHCLKMYPEPKPDKPGWWADYSGNPERWKCDIPYVYNVVSGYSERLYCDKMRENGPGKCTVFGDFFEPKLKAPSPEQVEHIQELAKIIRKSDIHL